MAPWTSGVTARLPAPHEQSGRGPVPYPMRRRNAWRLIVVLGMAMLASVAAAQSPPAPPKPAETSAAETPKPPPAIPLSEVALRAEETAQELRELREALEADRTEQAMAEQLAALSREVDAGLRENRKVLSRTSSIDTLRRLELRWARLGRSLAEESRLLSRRIGELERQIARVDEVDGQWTATLEGVKSGEAPLELTRRLQSQITLINRTRAALAGERARLLALQNSFATQESRIADVISATRRARNDVEARLFERDGPALWSGRVEPSADMRLQGQASLASQWDAVQAYAQRQPQRFLLHGVVFFALLAALYGLRRRAVPLAREEAELVDTAAVFGIPVATAIALSILGSPLIYPDAPMLWRALLGVLALVPALMILRRLLERDLLPVLYALATFYLIDQVRVAFSPLQLLPRLLFLAEAMAAAVFCLWLAVWMRPVAGPLAPPRLRVTIVRRASYVALAVLLAIFAANSFGYIALSVLLGNALFNSVYLALVLTGLVEVLNGLFIMALHMRPLKLLGAVRNHRPLLRIRFLRAMQWLAAALWAVFTLESVSLREPLFKAVTDFLTAELTLGRLHVSLLDLLAFLASLWAAVLVSRFIRFLLSEDIYPRFSLTRGLPYAISMTLHYLILVAGFLAAMAVLGLDMTKFTILAGAFTVGVGFGLQNIFNNFVSGIILLFERPIKVGDVIQIDNTDGVVESIGIRASILRAANGSEIIVPNGKLISERVVNWTLSGGQRSVDLPIAVVQGSDPATAIEVLERIAQQHPKVAKHPPPKAYAVRMGPDWMGLELRVWIDEPEQSQEVRSDLAVAAAAALKAANIALK